MNDKELIIIYSLDFFSITIITIDDENNEINQGDCFLSYKIGLI
jgi:hypothetical protein